MAAHSSRYPGIAAPTWGMPSWAGSFDNRGMTNDGRPTILADAGHVLLSREDRVAELVLARPAQANSISLTLAQELRATLEALHRPPIPDVVVLRSLGTVFCGGGDVKSFAEQVDLPRHLEAVLHHLHRACVLLRGLDSVVVASVGGAVAGAGLGLVLTADLVLASRSAKFAPAYPSVGLTPDAGTSWLLSRTVGPRRAAEMLLLNHVVGAEEAVECGLVAQLVDDPDLKSATDAVVARLISFGPGALRATKCLLRAAAGPGYEEHLDLEREILVRTAATADAAEGLRAFVEKRQPAFGPSTGR